jgi:hydrogenase maturation protease
VHLVRDPLPEIAPGRGLASATLVIGVGHEGRRDDAAGVRAARLVRALLWPRVRMVECEGIATSLIEAWRGEPAVVVVDAMSSGAPAGSVRRVDANLGPLPAERFRGSTHGLGLAEAVELARSLDEMPRSLLIFGIEGTDFGLGTGLSYPVECAVREAALLISEEILSRWGVQPPPAGAAH